jgi:hypothetical protein
MVRIVSFAGTLLVTAALAVSSLVFAGLAAAAPVCNGAVPAASSHALFPSGRGPASSADCEDDFDTSDTSMTDIGSAGSYPAASSYPNGSAAFTYAPQT